MQKELQAAGSRLRSTDQELQDTKGKAQSLAAELKQASLPICRLTLQDSHRIPGKTTCGMRRRLRWLRRSRSSASWFQLIACSSNSALQPLLRSPSRT